MHSLTNRRTGQSHKQYRIKCCSWLGLSKGRVNADIGPTHDGVMEQLFDEKQLFFSARNEHSPILTTHDDSLVPKHRLLYRSSKSVLKHKP